MSDSIRLYSCLVCVLLLCSILCGCTKYQIKNTDMKLSSIKLNEYLDEEVLDVCYDKPYLYCITTNHLLYIQDQILRGDNTLLYSKVLPIGGAAICSYGEDVYIFSEDGFVVKYDREEMVKTKQFDVSEITELHMYTGDVTKISANQDKIVIARGVYMDSIKSDIMRYYLLDTISGEILDISDRIHGDDKYSYLISISWIDNSRLSLVSVASNDMFSPTFTAYTYDIDNCLEDQIVLDFWASDCIYVDKFKSYIYSSDGYTYYCYTPTEDNITKLFTLDSLNSTQGQVAPQPIGKIQSCGSVLMIHLLHDNIIVFSDMEQYIK